MKGSPEELLDKVRGVSPQIADAREVAALIESLGYNDRSVGRWGFSDVFSLAEHIFLRFPPHSVPEQFVASHRSWRVLLGEAKLALRKFSLSFAYSIPWMALLVLEYLRPNALQVSPEFGGALSLSLIASLITTGGFIQMISRSGNFYFGMKEPYLARRWCEMLLKLGLVSSVVCMFLGIILGVYFRAFSASYLMLAAGNYVSLSLLWMLCAVMSVQGIAWCIPLIFAASATTVAAINLLAHPGTIVLLMLCPVVAVVCAAACVWASFRAVEKKNPDAKGSARPRSSVAFISLAPFYLYGTVYFGFLFADRLTAGTAIPWVSGLSFGIDSAYKRGMDLVLLAFLITAALVEVLSDAYLRYWRRLATELPQTGGDQLVAKLRKSHAKNILAIFLVFGVIAVAAWFAFCHLPGQVTSAKLLETAALGGLGYLLLSIALFENVILASVNATSLALRAVALGLGVNLLVGYGLSHLLGVQYAAAGLLAGSAVLFWRCNVAVRQVLRHPDYYFSIS
jgi:hypothetical protein